MTEQSGKGPCVGEQQHSKLKENVQRATIPFAQIVSGNVTMPLLMNNCLHRLSKGVLLVLRSHRLNMRRALKIASVFFMAIWL